MNLRWLLLFIPVTIALQWLSVGPIFVFLTSALAIIPLAALMGDATDALSEYMGPTWGSLVNAALGNAPEIIISLFALHHGLVGIVKASITGSIIGNLLFGLGLAMFAGGLKCGSQLFNERVARMSGALLTLAAFGLIIPAVFRFSSAGATRAISLEISGVLFLSYLASIVYTLVTNKPAIGKAAVTADTSASLGPAAAPSGWSRNTALGILALVTVGLALMSEMLTGAIEPASERLGLTPTFSGVFLLALVGNAAELFTSVRFARSDKMDLSLGITVGASIQVALVVSPVLVFFGALTGQNMDLTFSPFEVVAIALSVFVTRTLIYDGESTWLEGLLLMAVYCMLGFGFFYLPGNAPLGR